MADPARARKVADRIQETVARLLHGRVKDPRLGFVTITDVRVTGDLQQATVYYTVYGPQEDQKATARALESAKGLIRSEVGRALGIRLTPSLAFERDVLPEAARTLEDAVVQARARDEQIAESARGAAYAGAADPYRHEDGDDGTGSNGPDEDGADGGPHAHGATDVDAAVGDGDGDTDGDTDGGTGTAGDEAPAGESERPQ